MAYTFQCDKVLEQLVFVLWVCSDNFIEFREMGHLEKKEDIMHGTQNTMQ